MISINSSRAPARRRGLVSAAVLVTLLVIGLICAGLIKVALSRRAELAAEERRLQASWLAESGLARAIAKVEGDPAYPGETWEVSPESFGGRGRATVSIRVEPLPDRPGRKKVFVQADYPSGSSLRVRQSREMIVVAPSPSR